MASDPNIYVLGLGSIGLFAAHSLAESPMQHATTLLLHRRAMVDDYRNAGSQITLQTKGGETVQHGGYGVEVLEGDKWFDVSEPGSERSDMTFADRSIEQIVLAVKSIHTVAALRPLKHRLGRQSTILFLQNGSGMIEAVSDELFPDPDTRPNYIIGVISHGVNTNSPFNVTHTGPGWTSLGPFVKEVSRNGLDEDGMEYAENRSLLIKSLVQVPRFNARSYSFTEILQIQLEKLTMNAVCNPNAALANSTNDCLLKIPDTLQHLTEEISAIALKLPELQQIPGVQQRFASATLLPKVFDIINKTLATTGSMCCDLRAKKKTEVQLINGYWSRRGKEVGVETPFNDEIIRKIEAREASNVNH